MARPPPDPYFVLRSHQGAITALHFTKDEESCGSDTHACLPSGSSSCLLSGSDIGEIFLWNLKVNRIAYRFHGQGEKMILWLFYFKGKIISQIRETGVKIWSYADAEWTVTDSIQIGQAGFCSSTMLNSQLIVPGPKDPSVSIIDFWTCVPKSVLEPCEQSCGMCLCVTAFQYNEKEYVVCGYENGCVMLWDCQSADIISKLSCHSEPVICLDFLESPRCAGISGSADEYLHTWKLNDEFQLVTKEKIKLPNPGVASVAIRPDGKIVIVGCWDNNLRVFSWKTLKPLAVLCFHNGTISCLKFCLDEVGKYKNVFAAGSKDKNVSLWSLY